MYTCTKLQSVAAGRSAVDGMERAQPRHNSGASGQSFGKVIYYQFPCFFRICGNKW